MPNPSSGGDDDKSEGEGVSPQSSSCNTNAPQGPVEVTDAAAFDVGDVAWLTRPTAFKSPRFARKCVPVCCRVGRVVPRTLLRLFVAASRIGG